MVKWMRVAGAVLLATAATAQPASADWLLTGYVSPIFNVKTSENIDFGIPDESFDGSTGFGINLASAFPNTGNLGFELDFGFYPKALAESDVYGTDFSSQLMTINTNFFYSPAVPRFRPYFSVGPSFSYRSDRDEAIGTTPSGWGIGVNGGGGLMIFATERFAVRIDGRYFRHFGDFYDLRADADERTTGFKDLSFFRIFFGATLVL